MAAMAGVRTGRSAKSAADSRRYVKQRSTSSGQASRSSRWKPSGVAGGAGDLGLRHLPREAGRLDRRV